MFLLQAYLPESLPEECENSVSLWLAVTDVPVEAGCLRFIPGSHLEDLRKHTPGMPLAWCPGHGRLVLYARSKDSGAYFYLRQLICKRAEHVVSIYCSAPFFAQICGALPKRGNRLW